MIGKKIGKYEIKELLGQGGMGKVYKAAHPILDRDVAIKLVHIAHITDSTTLNRFRREAKVVAALRHPNIVQLYDFDIAGDTLYMVMEYVPGESLAQRLTGIYAQNKKLPLEEALRTFGQITQAVSYAHKQKVIHCDLKPDNVLITPNEVVILTDFGTSKFINAERLTATGGIMGTPHYMSPEQATGEALDTYTDVYTLGVMLYELTTGVLPFRGDTMMSIVFKHVNDEPEPPQSIIPDLPDALVKIIQTAMAKAPADRYPSAQELLAVIEAPPSSGRKIFDTRFISEDGQLISHSDTAAPPLPAFNPNFLKDLAAPGGAVKLRDKFYIERSVDAQLQTQAIQCGTTTTIRAPRQTGKTSLLMRGIRYARTHEANVIFLDFQSFGPQMASLDLFLQELAASICDELDLDEDTADRAWRGSRSPTKKLTRFIEKQVLPNFNGPIVLAMDEADSLLQTNFYKDVFALLRSWHNRRASRQIWEKLNLILVISTEPYLLIDDIHQSPFNVGLHLSLTDFDKNQIADLNRRHGSPVSEQDLPEFMDLLNGHPFLVRLALYTMVTEEITWPELKRQAPTDDGPFGDHLRRQYWIIHDKPELKDALKGILLSQQCADEKALFRLLQAGIIKGSGDLYSCRCVLYKQYFENKLV